MKGKTKSAPTSVKPMLSGGPAASLIDMAGGMMFGHRLIANQYSPGTAAGARAGTAMPCVSFPKHANHDQVVATTSRGTGEKMMMLGNENHRVAMPRMRERGPHAHDDDRRDKDELTGAPAF